MKKSTTYLLSTILLLLSYSSFSQSKKLFKDKKEYSQAINKFNQSIEDRINDSIEYERNLAKYNQNEAYNKKIPELIKKVNKIILKDVWYDISDGIKNNTGKYNELNIITFISVRRDFTGYKGDWPDTLSFSQAKQLTKEGYGGWHCDRLDDYMKEFNLKPTFKLVHSGDVIWYCPFFENKPKHFSKPQKPKKENIPKPIFDPYNGLTYFPRELAPSDYIINGNNLMGAFALTQPSSWRNINERPNTIPLTTDIFKDLPPELQNKYLGRVGANAWKEKIKLKKNKTYN